ncbi:ead/Ea22-like family protein [Cronobacter sakazakii]|uniref:ead/Ea22-like family protein n=1 Tax=Cronobacter sakazakii TaxID=28141 RepID=UPI00159ED92C|nr:ead/Ea22-like family protein [Cronobacter sakazakii]ELY4706859.1 ead/Ea22-like family protein [Cronobacter sakazakii]MDK1241840.1 ead/Ea22-like family protein [Cronobacter sakazakii]MDT3614607.1 ead/Ea22-like family protein [Cronobacter sakazakii]MDT3617233.1 ead/Ea22-like family protein [Cronobacter sakazakii]
MTDTAKLKAAAEKARWGDWSAYKPHSGARGYEVRVGSEAVAQHCLKDDAAFIAEASPKAVLCLIAALEASHKRNAELLEKQRLIDICQGQGLEHRIAAETRAEAAEKRVAELEARTFKLPESVIESICLTAAEIHNLGRGVSDERAQDIIDSIRCAAGINLETGGE